MKGNQKRVPNERRRQSLRIQNRTQLQKGRNREFTRAEMQPMQPLEFYFKSSYQQCVVPTIGEQIMLARIIDEEREYDRQGSPSDTWNYWLNVKQKNIWWKELYELDQAARGVEERILEFMGEGFVGLHVTVETKLEALGSRMSHIEKNQRLLRRRAKKMEDRLTSIESKVQPSHGEDMDFRQWDYGTYEEKEKANSEKDKANAEQEAGK
ncbi:hypothetical protein DY000_02030468 [Brassica cretica]|uniref:DUF287 domain-containing protein n=1 Tax=Brassica cretica TaxID=69181 RepID=A0ABQ7DG16_BRACR|nr:hypothetical protein DY000_02030468 [Brassica cretica]